MELTYACPNDEPFLWKLWTLCFGGPEDYLDLYFQNRFVPEDTLIARENGVPVAMLTLMNARIGDHKGFYIYAVATHPDYQGRGLQRQLDSYTVDVMRKRGGEFCCLVPAEESLFGFYEKLGYGVDFYRWEKRIEDDTFCLPTEFSPCSYQMFAGMRAEYLNTLSNALVHPDRELRYIYRELCGCCGSVLRFSEESRDCYAAYTAEGGQLYLREQTGADPEQIARSLMGLCGSSSAVIASACPFPGAERRAWGMGKWLGEGSVSLSEHLSGPGYMALMLD